MTDNWAKSVEAETANTEVIDALKSHQYRNAYLLKLNDSVGQRDYNIGMSVRHPNGMKMYADQARMKKCKTCYLILELKGFHKDKGLKDGHRNICKSCAIKAAFLSQQSNRAKRKKYLREYTHKNREILKQYHKSYYLETRDNKRREYLRNTLVTRRLYNCQYERRKAKDPIWRLRRGLRTRLNRAIRGSYRNGSAINDLGCSIEFLKTHLETKFQTGMTWGNWGRYGWHIDHIKPLAQFDLTKRSNIKKAVHYMNLQPLWWIDNLSKNKIA